MLLSTHRRSSPCRTQLTAVYGSMLDRQPLRFLLADDPGAGKTVMAGLLIKELLIRGSLERCLIVAPGSLVEQWQDELKEKFDLAFDIVSREHVETSVSGNPFAERPRLIARLDMLARNDELQAKLKAAPEWDLIVCDEAHRMSASFFGQEVKYTLNATSAGVTGRAVGVATGTWRARERDRSCLQTGVTPEKTVTLPPSPIGPAPGHPPCQTIGVARRCCRSRQPAGARGLVTWCRCRPHREFSRPLPWGRQTARSAAPR